MISVPDLMDGVITFLHIAGSILLIIVVLLQQSKGDGMGSTFGGGGSQSVLGARGAATVITKLTTFLAILFMSTSLILAYFSSQRASDSLLKEPTVNGLSIPEQRDVTTPAQNEPTTAPDASAEDASEPSK